MSAFMADLEQRIEALTDTAANARVVDDTVGKSNNDSEKIASEGRVVAHHDQSFPRALPVGVLLRRKLLKLRTGKSSFDTARKGFVPERVPV